MHSDLLLGVFIFNCIDITFNLTNNYFDKHYLDKFRGDIQRT